MTSRQKGFLDLKGNTLRVYTHLFKVQKSGPRETQRAVGLKSASLAQYHLDKLVSLGLATKSEINDDYVLLKEIKIEALEQFLKIGSYIIPRFVLYSTILTILLSYFMITTLLAAGAYPLLTPTGIWAVVFGVCGVVITWYETVKAWMRSP